MVTPLSEMDNTGRGKGLIGKDEEFSLGCAELGVCGKIKVEGSRRQLEKSWGWGEWSGLRSTPRTVVARVLNEAAQDSEDTELRAELCRILAFRGGQKGDELTQSLSRRDQEVGKSQEDPCS